MRAVHTYVRDHLNPALGQSRAVADRYGLAMITDEGGQHLCGIQGGENDDALTAAGGFSSKYDAPPADSSKYQEVLRFARQVGQSVPPV